MSGKAHVGFFLLPFTDFWENLDAHIAHNGKNPCDNSENSAGVGRIFCELATPQR